MKLNATIRTENRPTETIVDGQRAVQRFLELSATLDYRHEYCRLSAMNTEGEEVTLLVSEYNENTQEIDGIVYDNWGGIKEEFFPLEEDVDNVFEWLFR